MRTVSPGQPFSMSAEEFNGFQQAAQFARSALMRRGAHDGIGSSTDRTQPLVVSTEEEPIRAFSVVKIDGIQEKPTGGPTDDFIGLTPLKVTKPTGIDDSFLILQDGLPDVGSAARAVSDGITPAWVNFEDGEDDAETAGPDLDNFDLKAGGTGTKIIWRPTGTGSLLCVVRIEPASIPGGAATMHVARLTEVLYAGTSASATLIYNDTPMGSVVVHDDIMPGDTEIPAEAIVYIAKFADCKYRVMGVSCDVLGDGSCGTGYLEEDPPVEE